MRVFLSYRRSSGRWIARAVRQALEARKIEVFLDFEDIDSGRFESVILNQIDLCEHFLVLLDEPTMTGMGVDGNWVGREVDRALALGKNVGCSKLRTENSFRSSVVKSFLSSGFSSFGGRDGTNRRSVPCFQCLRVFGADNSAIL